METHHPGQAIFMREGARSHAQLRKACLHPDIIMRGELRVRVDFFSVFSYGFSGWYQDGYTATK
jgi:hypothetical protein